MDETKMNADLHTMVTLGLIGQNEAVEQYPKIQEISNRASIQDIDTMCIIAYFTTIGWRFLDVLELLEKVMENNPISLGVYKETVLSDAYLEFEKAFYAHRIQYLK